MSNDETKTDNATPTSEMSVAQQMSYDAEREMKENCRKYWKDRYKQIMFHIGQTEQTLEKFKTEMKEHMKKDPDTLMSRLYPPGSRRHSGAES